MEHKQASKRVVLSYLHNVDAGEGKKYDPEQLKIGIKIEKEHKNVYEMFKKVLKENGIRIPMSLDEFSEMVAKAHLDEVADYYTKLTKHVEPEGHKEAMDFTGISPLITPDQPLDDREMARIIRLAIAAEHDAASLYELIADSASNESIKDVLESVAAEEKVHIGELQKVLSSLDEDDEELIAKGREEAEELMKGNSDEDENDEKDDK